MRQLERGRHMGGMERYWESRELTAEREWTVEGIPVLTATVALPWPAEGQRSSLSGQSQSRRAARKHIRRIQRYYKAQCRAFLRYCESALFPMAADACRAALAASAPLPCFHAELSYQVTYDHGGFWSLYTQVQEPVLDGSPLLRRWGDTWDLRTGQLVPLGQFFPPRSGWRRQLPALAAQAIQAQEESGCSRYLPGWRHLVRRRFDPLRYYLTEAGLAFFYPMYAIAPAIEGIPVFTVPYGGGLRCCLPGTVPEGSTSSAEAGN